MRSSGRTRLARRRFGEESLLQPWEPEYQPLAPQDGRAPSYEALSGVLSLNPLSPRPGPVATSPAPPSVTGSSLPPPGRGLTGPGARKWRTPSARGRAPGDPRAAPPPWARRGQGRPCQATRGWGLAGQGFLPVAAASSPESLRPDRCLDRVLTTPPPPPLSCPVCPGSLSPVFLVNCSSLSAAGWGGGSLMEITTH